MFAQLLLTVAALDPSPAPARLDEPPLRPAMVVDALLVIDEVAGRVVRVRDADGDGCADLVVARGAHIGAVSRIELLSGRTGAVIRSLARIDAVAETPLPWDAGADVDLDGVDDLAIGFPEDVGRHGNVHVVSGASGTILRVLHGTRANDRFGSALAFIGDVDGDGRAELAIGACGVEPAIPRRMSARWETPRSAGSNGSVVLHSGADGRELWRIDGASGAGFGAFVGAVGDLDADGRRDLAIRSRAGSNAPLVLVSAARGVEIAKWSMRSGRVIGAGDLDGDRVPDLLHEFAYDEGGFGYVRVHSGSNGALVRELPGPDIFPDWRSLADVGDVDGDGVDDVAIGDTNFGMPKAAPGCAALDVRTMTIEQAASLESEPDSVGCEAGCVHVRSGRTGQVVFGVWAAREPWRGLGYEVTRGPDVDRDGTDDLVVTDSSRAHVVRVPPRASPRPR